MISFYSSAGRGKWQRVSRSQPCLICGRPDWCLFTGPADSPDAVICSRVESEKRVGTKGAGWLHRLRDDSFRPERRNVKIVTPAEPLIDFGAMAAECFRALGPLRRGALALELGVTVKSLERLCVGWSERYRAYTFPMRDADRGDICYGVRGIRLRSSDGSKWSVRGGREGLFLPYLGADDHLLVCEGPSDCAALLDLCCEAVGRPSCTGGTRLLIELVRSGEWREVVIVADADPPGRRGAERLAMALVAYVGGVRIITPPAGIKDAREWKRQGAIRDSLLAAIDAAPVLQLRVAAHEVTR